MEKIKSVICKLELAAIKIENAERGEATLEYAVIAVVIIGVVLGAMRGLGISIADVFTRAASSLGG
jgi:Flp pilus assembly pilin Flp